MIKSDKILVLAPHTDDGEIGCGGTISKMISEGKEVFYIAFSTCKKSVPDELPSNILSIEVRKATNDLGIPKNNLFILDYPVREFKSFRQEILDDLIFYKKKINPDLIFLPSKNDIHQDHSVISDEGFRAFKDKNILGYEVAWNNTKFNNDFFISLRKQDIENKIKALSNYKSQKSRGYFTKDYIYSLAKIRGVQAKLDLAECFEVLRLYN